MPQNELAMVLDNFGLSPSFTVHAYIDNGTISDFDGEILVSLNPKHGPTADYVAQLREALPKKFPGCTFNFQPADITSQILDFGLPAPIDVQVVGVDRPGNLRLAQKLRKKMLGIPGIADVHMQQVTDYPTIHVDVDRIRASEVGLTQQSTTGSILVSLSGTSQVTPNFWVNPDNRVDYPLVVQTPPYRIANVDVLANTPIINGISNVSMSQLPSNLQPIIAGGPGTGGPLVSNRKINCRRPSRSC